MRFKELFSVPEGKKVTEKAFAKVLVSSICGILLCMTCLVTTTWAWFAVSIENTGNEIWIGESKINVTVDGSAYTAGTELPGDDITLGLTHANKSDDFDRKSTLYVTLTLQSVKEITSVYVTLNESNNYSAEINVENDTGKPCDIRWTVSWFAPVNAGALVGDTITLEAEEIEPSTQATTEASQEVTTEATTEPQTEPSTEATTSPTTETEPEATDSTDPSEEETTAPTTETEPEATDSTDPSEEETTSPTTETEPEATDSTDPSEEETTSPTTETEPEATNSTDPSEEETTAPTTETEPEATDSTDPSEEATTSPTTETEPEATDSTDPDATEATDEADSDE